MGVLYEVNWYLVIGTESDIEEISTNKFTTVKTEKRVYPIGAPIPLIIKNIGCIGMVEVENIKIGKKTTEIEFSFSEKFEPDNVIASHYYNMYKSIKG